MNKQKTANHTMILQATNIHYAYIDKNQHLSILEDLNFSVKGNDKIAIVGASGTGKSTLLHVLSALDKPQKGTIELCGQLFSSPKKISAKRQGALRNKHLGFVYQFHHLLPEFTALENVMLPLLVQKTNRTDAAKTAQILLDKVGVGARYKHKPSALSGGERQRVAIARAMVAKPNCILADEPTGNLDTETAQSVMQMLFELQDSEKTALIIVTHDIEIAKNMQTIYRLENKRLNRL